MPTTDNKKTPTDIARHWVKFQKSERRYKLTKYIHGIQEIKFRNKENSDNTRSMQLARKLVKSTGVEIPQQNFS